MKLAIFHKAKLGAGRVALRPDKLQVSENTNPGQHVVVSYESGNIDTNFDVEVLETFDEAVEILERALAE